MNKKILILGASGNFGSKIAKRLAKDNLPIIVAGRQEKLLVDLKNEIIKFNPQCAISIAIFDIQKEIVHELTRLKPFIVINTCGPFQTADYSIASACIEQGIHYIDLADGREFVNHFHSALDKKAKEHHCLAITGASTVPCLSSAVLNHFKNEFSLIESLIYGITPGQKTDRGLATTKAILSYVGKPLKPVAQSSKTIYGWQDLYRQTYPSLGTRWMANCDIPDLDLFQNFYHIQDIQFSAGIESSFLHLSLWILSWCVRLGFPLRLQNHAKSFLKISHWFDRFGSNDGGMHMIISGKDLQGKPKTIKWFIIARNGSGPHIPTIPSIILSKKLLQDKIHLSGAITSMNLITLEEYLSELQDDNIQTDCETS